MLYLLLAINLLGLWFNFLEGNYLFAAFSGVAIGAILGRISSC